MKKFLLYLWQLPQNLIALIILGINKKSQKHLSEIDGIKVWFVEKGVFNAGVSLGNYILVYNKQEKLRSIKNTAKHEHGHQIQSTYLGWFYLLIIGIPSALGNVYDRWYHIDWDYKKREKWYYNQPWEKWADKLGGVDRKS